MSPEKERPTNVAPSSIAIDAGVDRRQVVDDPRLQLRTEVGSGGELPLGETVNAIVLNDVDQGQIAPHEMGKLAEADGGRIPVAADPQAHHGVVGHQRAGGHGGHAAMDAIEAVGPVHEVGGSLRGAADTGELHHTLWLDAHLVHGIDYALRDRVMSAAGAKGGLPSAVVQYLQTKTVLLGAGSRRWIAYNRRH